MHDWIAAIMRIGLVELKDFCMEFFPTSRAQTFLEESCGVADIMTSCEYDTIALAFLDLCLCVLRSERSK